MNSSLINDGATGSEDVRQLVNYKDLFMAPALDELNKLARDDKGKRKQLNEQQFKQIRKEGYFDVESLAQPGEKHRWQLASWLQEGYTKSSNSFVEVN